MGMSAFGEAAVGGHSTWNIEGICPRFLGDFSKERSCERLYWRLEKQREIEDKAIEGRGTSLTVQGDKGCEKGKISGGENGFPAGSGRILRRRNSGQAGTQLSRGFIAWI